MKLDDLRVAHKLWGVVLGLLVVLSLAAGFTLYQLGSVMNHALKEVEAHELSITRSTRWLGLTETVIERTMAFIYIDDPVAAKSISQRSTADSAKITELQGQIKAAITTEAEKQAFETVFKTRASALALLKKLPEIKAQGDPAATHRFTTQEFEPAAGILIGALQDFLKVEEAELARVKQAAEEAKQQAALLGSLTALGVLGIAVFLAYRLVRSITIPLHRTVAAAKAISAGDLSQNLERNRKDEFGELLQSFDDMSRRLRTLVSEVRSGVESVSAASSEIASGNQDLSSRTEQTAANLEETAASLEQITSTVTQSADTARQANQLAINAAQAAQRGGTVVGQVVQSMQQITESSRRISDIIGVIDGIAFQTNILALNAAVEAARAGEQGRGFAVVAGEVRTLAQRSAEAAKEIKELINASVLSVDAGSQQVGEAGVAMDEIVSGVRQVSDLIAEISSASSEQREGIEQVNRAVGNLDQMTQQNAALVEESAAAAAALRDQAQKLADVVSVFNVGSHVPSSYRTPSLSSSQPTHSAPSRSTQPDTPLPAPSVKKAKAPAAANQSAIAPKLKAPPATLPSKKSQDDEGDWESF